MNSKNTSAGIIPSGVSSHRGSSGYLGYFNTFLKYSFYLTLLCIFAFMLLIVLQFLGFKAFSFLPDDGGFITIPLLPTNRQIAFTKNVMPSNEAADLKNIVASNYTISLDVYIKNEFVSQSIPRVLLYRATSPVTLLATDNTIAKIANKMPQTNFILYLDPYSNDLMANIYVIPRDTVSGSPSGSPSGMLTASGSTASGSTVSGSTATGSAASGSATSVSTASGPAASGPAASGPATSGPAATAGGSCVCPPGGQAGSSSGTVGGAILGGVATSSLIAGSTLTNQPSLMTNAKIMTMPKIENIPMKTPFRITMMVSDVLLEVYINGELEKSVPLIGGSPLNIQSNSKFYGPPDITRQSVLVSNISYWNTSLTSHSIRTYGKEGLNSAVFTS